MGISLSCPAQALGGAGLAAPELISRDGIHPTADGYAAIAAAVARGVRCAVDGPCEAAPPAARRAPPRAARPWRAAAAAPVAVACWRYLRRRRRDRHLPHDAKQAV